MSVSQKRGIIAVLEDNADRRAAMSALLADRFYPYEAAFFDDTAEMIKFLKAQLPHVILIALDHDLELKQTANGKCMDPGCGTDIADFLASQPATCPVVIHSTNSAAAEGMALAMEEVGWRVHRVTPFGDLEWIPKVWLRTVRQAIIETAIASSVEEWARQHLPKP
jgi:CheY-like chemotaxis protein